MLRRLQLTVSHIWPLALAMITRRLLQSEYIGTARYAGKHTFIDLCPGFGREHRECRRGRCLIGRAPRFSTMQNRSTVTCPMTTLCFENRCLHLHNTSASASKLSAFHTPLSKPKHISCKCDRTLSHTRLNAAR